MTVGIFGIAFKHHIPSLETFLLIILVSTFPPSPNFCNLDSSAGLISTRLRLAILILALRPSQPTLRHSSLPLLVSSHAPSIPPTDPIATYLESHRATASLALLRRATDRTLTDLSCCRASSSHPPTLSFFTCRPLTLSWGLFHPGSSTSPLPPSEDQTYSSFCCPGLLASLYLYQFI